MIVTLMNLVSETVTTVVRRVCRPVVDHVIDPVLTHVAWPVVSLCTTILTTVVQTLYSLLVILCNLISSPFVWLYSLVRGVYSSSQNGTYRAAANNVHSRSKRSSRSSTQGQSFDEVDSYSAQTGSRLTSQGQSADIVDDGQSEWGVAGLGWASSVFGGIGAGASYVWQQIVSNTLFLVREDVKIFKRQVGIHFYTAL